MGVMPSFDLASASSFQGEGDATQGAEGRAGGVRALINTNIATGRSSLSAGLSASEGLDWRLIGIVAAAGLAGWYILKRK